jgi:hypothetical protein
MAVPWVISITSVVFAPHGVVNSIIDLPVSLTTTDRPVDPRKPDKLPKLPGVDYDPYRMFFAAQKFEASPPR